MIKEKIVIYPETKYQLPVVQQQHVQPYCGYNKPTVTLYELEQEIKKAQKLNIDIGIALFGHIAADSGNYFTTSNNSWKKTNNH